MKNLIIIGAGGHGKVCADIAQRMNTFKSIKFFDENKAGKVMDIEIVQSKNIEEIINQDTENFVAIGDNHIRSEKIELVLNLGANLATLIDPSAIISKSVNIGQGTVVMPNVVINSSAQIGIGVILNTSSIIEHDCILEDYVHISPSAVLAGGAKIGSKVWIGANSSIRECVKIGRNSIIGMGSVVTKEVESNIIAVGIPAIKIKSRCK